MPLSGAYVLVGISHICAEVKTSITIHQNLVCALEPEL